MKFSIEQTRCQLIWCLAKDKECIISWCTLNDATSSRESESQEVETKRKKAQQWRQLKVDKKVAAQFSTFKHVDGLNVAKQQRSTPTHQSANSASHLTFPGRKKTFVKPNLKSWSLSPSALNRACWQKTDDRSTRKMIEWGSFSR